MPFEKFRKPQMKYLSKNKSVKLFKEKNKKREKFIQQRQTLKKLHEQIDASKIECFDQFPLTFETKKGLKKFNYVTPTEIQKQTIGLALQSHDILGAAKTGSGKTLAFVIPILERLYCEGWCKTDGLGALVITPTRELALQIFQVCQKVGSFHDFTIGLVIGGKDLRDERKILHLYNIVICTPGRLLMHLDQNALFQAENLQMLVLDEADRILDDGFQREVNAILEHLESLNKQTLLFSATQTKSVKDLARLSLKNPMYVSVHEHAKHATPETLEQSFVVCELQKKIDFIWSFIKSHKKQKILIFMASCKQVKYVFDAFCRMKPGMSIMALYGGLHQLKRIERYQEFCRKNAVVMFATDLAARGLDFPNVNWVVQLDCPEDVTTYIHRAGRTARYQKGGESLLVLLPSEKDSMIKQLKDRKIPINEIKVHPKKIISVQRKMDAQCARDVNLKESAQRAFVSYYKNIFLMKDKTIFDIMKLNALEVREGFARSLGLAFAPRTRFIEKRLKNTEIKKFVIKQREENDSEQEESSDTEQGEFLAIRQNLEMNSDSDSNDDFLIPKDKEASQNFLLTDDGYTSEENMNTSKKSQKTITKAAVAKRVLKKKIKPNMKVVFDDEGNAIEGVLRKPKDEISNELIKQMSEEGYSVEKAKLIMDQEDAIDKALYRSKIKQKHKEKRLKLKEQRRNEKQSTNKCELGKNEDEGKEEDEMSSGSDIDLNNLPDSESEEDDRNNEDQSSENSGTESEEEREEQQHSKRKRGLTKEALKPSKRFKEDINETENNFIGTLEDEENLALHFLTNS